MPKADVASDAWKKIVATEAIFQEGSACNDCPFFETWREPHGEQMSECGALLNTSNDCPELERRQARQRIWENPHG